MKTAITITFNIVVLAIGAVACVHAFGFGQVNLTLYIK